MQTHASEKIQKQNRFEQKKIHHMEKRKQRNINNSLLNIRSVDEGQVYCLGHVRSSENQDVVSLSQVVNLAMAYDTAKRWQQEEGYGGDQECLQGHRARVGIFSAREKNATLKIQARI